MFTVGTELDDGHERGCIQEIECEVDRHGAVKLRLTVMWVRDGRAYYYSEHRGVMQELRKWIDNATIPF